MFKSIQKQLLLQYPLLWNTKFIPMLVIGIGLHILFFGLGYLDGTIDFSNRNNIDIELSCVLFGILFVIIIVILWLVYYFKNNALKSFYSKSENSLFYEWLQIFVISLLLVSFYIPFSIGKQLHQRNYFSLEEATKRCEIISMADIFIDGSFASTEPDSILKSNLTKEEYNFYLQKSDYSRDGNYFYFDNDSMTFDGKKYSKYSLLNRNTFDFTLISNNQDSLNKLKVKNWLHQNQAVEVKNFMKRYLQLIEEHHLATNLTLDKWFEITYKAPDFVDFLYIIPYKNEYETKNHYSYQYDYTVDIEETRPEKYSKYFIQQGVLKDKYDTVSDAYTNPFFSIDMILSFLYGAFVFSMLLFSFRVTSGKSWLIALVTVGVINIIYGILTAVTRIDTLYACLILFTILGVTVYFFFIYTKKKSLELSKIALNLILWSFVLIIPIIYFLIEDYFLANNYIYNDTYSYRFSKECEWMREHTTEMFLLNFIISIVVLFGLSRVIRNWKGIAEN